LLTCHWRGPDQPLVIDLAFLVGGCHWLRPGDAVVDRQPNQQNAIADPIERSPPETTSALNTVLSTCTTISGL
jgi:hypothetical protein